MYMYIVRTYMYMYMCMYMYYCTFSPALALKETLSRARGWSSLEGKPKVIINCIFVHTHVINY